MKLTYLIPGVSDHEADDLFPELRGFQITPESEEAMMAVENELLEGTRGNWDLASLESEMSDVLSQLGEVEMEIAELKSKERSLEEREAEIEDEISEIRASPPAESIPFPSHFGCTECPWSSYDLLHSSEHRAEGHSIETGHQVAIVLSDGSQFFEQDRIVLEVRT